jgi:phage shock protein C
MQAPNDQRFYRGRDRIVGGVCSGLGEGLHIDPIWVRLAFVVLAFAQGIGVVLYVVLWVIMPERGQERPAGRTAFDSMSDDIKRAWANLRGQFGGRPPAGSTSQATAAPPPPPAAAAASVPSSGHATQVLPPLPPTSAPPPAAPAQRGVHNQSVVLGVILVLIGLAFLLSNTGFVNWSEIWPIALIALGIVLLARSLESRS